jgi:hypothetical protein
MTAADHTFFVLITILLGVIVVVAVVTEPISSRRAEWYVREWATERGYRLVSIKRLWWSTGHFPIYLGWLSRRNASRYYGITTIDDRSVERVGTARVYPRWINGERTVVRWRSERQLCRAVPASRFRGMRNL